MVPTKSSGVNHVWLVMFKVYLLRRVGCFGLSKALKDDLKKLYGKKNNIIYIVLYLLHFNSWSFVCRLVKQRPFVALVRRVNVPACISIRRRAGYCWGRDRDNCRSCLCVQLLSFRLHAHTYLSSAVAFSLDRSTLG